MKAIHTTAQLQKTFLSAHRDVWRRLRDLRNFEVIPSSNDYDALILMVSTLVKARKQLDKELH